MIKNRLYYGDNLDILGEYIKDETIDLIYLDPPFKSNQDYNVLFEEHNGTKSKAQIKAFEDTWRWDQGTAESYAKTVEAAGQVSKVLQAFRQILGENDMMAYLSMMAPRLKELCRVLKPTGSIYLHCDPTASHYLKILMDAIFGGKNFRNEIIWHYRKWPSGYKQFQRNHDVLLFYSRSESPSRTFNQLYMPRAESTLKRFGTSKIISGYDKAGKRIPSKTDERESVGVRQDDVWEIGRVPPIKQLFPTQKPEKLLEKIILASTKKGQTILDPFCGCGTTVMVAQKLRRQWIGIDITPLAIALIKHRLKSGFTETIKYDVIGEPVSLPDAQELAKDDPYQFQWWALGLVGARPVEKRKGADKGIDGRIYFHDEAGKLTKQIILSVKSGKVTVKDIREIEGVVKRENAQIGVLITLRHPTGPMTGEAASFGFYNSPWGKQYPRIQILTIEDILGGREIKYPPSAQVNVTFKKTGRMDGDTPVPNGELFE